MALWHVRIGKLGEKWRGGGKVLKVVVSLLLTVESVKMNVKQVLNHLDVKYAPSGSTESVLAITNPLTKPSFNWKKLNGFSKIVMRKRKILLV